MNLETDLNDASILALRIKNLSAAATAIATQSCSTDRMENDEIVFSIMESIKHFSIMLSNHLDSMEANALKDANNGK